MADRTPAQQQATDVCDRVLKLNEDTNRILSELTRGAVLDSPGGQLFMTIRQNLRQIDLEVLSLDRGIGHVSVSISQP